MKAIFIVPFVHMVFACIAYLPVMGAAEEADWYPSRYGATDTIGAANNLSEAGVLKAASLVTRGKTYQLD